MRMRIAPKGASNTDMAIVIGLIAIAVGVVGWGLPQMSVSEPNTSSQCQVGVFANNVTETNGTLLIYCSSVGWQDLTGFPSPCEANKFVIAVNTTLACTFVDWTQINNYPGGCTSGMFVTAVGPTLSCDSPSNPESASNAICQAGKFVNSLNESSTGVLSYSCFYPDWSRLTGFPSGCSSEQFVTGIGVTLTCSALAWSSITGFPSACGTEQFVTAVGNSLTCNFPWFNSYTGYWKFDEESGTSAADSSSFGSTGTLVCTGGGCAVPVWISSGSGFCHVHSCLKWDGTTVQYVNITTNSGANSRYNLPTAWTFSAWVWTNTTGSHTFMTKGRGGANAEIIIQETATDAVQTFTYGSFKSTANSFLPEQAWHYLTVSFDGHSEAYYLDGVLKTSLVVGTGTFDTVLNFPLVIGIQGSQSASNIMKGFMEEVKIFPFALSAAQAEYLYLNTP